MNICVCLKSVPIFTGEIEVDRQGRKIKDEGLGHSLGETDSYALDEALELREIHGGMVIALTYGEERAKEALHIAMARGAEEAIQILDETSALPNPLLAAKVLAKAIGNVPYDLVLTGVQSDDFCASQTGVLLAEELGISHVSIVTKVVLSTDRKVIVNRDVGGGAQEVVEVGLPALFTIQSGITAPRYTSSFALMKARKRGVQVTTPSRLGFSPDELNVHASKFKIISMASTVGKKAQIIGGSTREAARDLLQKLKSEGVL